MAKYRMTKIYLWVSCCSGPGVRVFWSPNLRVSGFGCAGVWVSEFGCEGWPDTGYDEDVSVGKALSVL
jgi:hypothetical protein